MTTYRYIAQRPLQVGDRTVGVGEEIPEAAEWRNLKAYVANGSISVTPESGTQVSRIDALEARIAELESQLGVVPGTEAAPSDADDGTGAGHDDDMVTGYLDAGELGKWTREQLEAVGAEMGVTDAADRSVFPNKDALIATLVTIPVEVPANDDDATQERA